MNLNESPIINQKGDDRNNLWFHRFPGKSSQSLIKKTKTNQARKFRSPTTENWLELKLRASRKIDIRQYRRRK